MKSVSFFFLLFLNQEVTAAVSLTSFVSTSLSVSLGHSPSHLSLFPHTPSLPSPNHDESSLLYLFDYLSLSNSIWPTFKCCYFNVVCVIPSYILNRMLSWHLGSMELIRCSYLSSSLSTYSLFFFLLSWADCLFRIFLRIFFRTLSSN